MNPKKILVISPVTSHPQNAGNRTRIYEFLYNLKKLGHKIYFVYENRERYQRHPQKPDIKAMQKEWDKLYLLPYTYHDIPKDINMLIGRFGIFLKKTSPNLYKKLKILEGKIRVKKDAKIDDTYNSSLDILLKKIIQKEKFDAILVEYSVQSKALENFDDSVLKVIDTHDALTSREAIKANKKFDDFSVYTNDEEAKAINRADIIISIQDHEKKFFEKLVNKKEKKVVTIGHIREPKKLIERNPERKNIFFIGFINHANDYGIKFFIKEVFPKIREKHPDSKLIIAGEICKMLPSGKNIIKLGKVKDIEKAYSLADIVICPLFFGTGLKIKNIEALAHGKPLITTGIGIKGIEKGKNKAFLVANTAEEFADVIEKIFSDKKLYKNLSKNAHKFMKEYNKKNIETLKSIFNIKKKKIV